ncbi:hypothetical protein FOMPIDRAFT_1021408 [Fomitopsis schrenkii]|uniref:LysM domain-containing protein n=1 Tax=Fomitopsis schrenkii TaxID=2126942 RepID=S8G632_FOMSC|nr:hypothetical protein FOMPIDRAFT_1021408 [Fomitopsis schrenkii]
MTSPRSTLDPSISLCLACSASLPPRKALASPTSPNYASNEIFLTECCQRPICPACVSANPRLVRYHPCLHCLGGVGAVSAAARSPPPVDFSRSVGEKSAGGRVNVDGSVKDEDVFVLGDDDEDEEESMEGTVDGHGDRPSTASNSPPPATPPPAYFETTLSQSSRVPSPSTQPISKIDCGKQPNQEMETTSSTPQRYYIQPNDTLIGIALRFHVDGRTLCRLNDLPLSTLRTTPHLLHTRTSLVLPASAASGPKSLGPILKQPGPDESARRARERAESRFRVLTKEADYRVARAYVAIAGVEDDAADAFREDEAKKSSPLPDAIKRLRPSSSAEAGGSLEGRAVDKYLDDEEWEERQRNNGRSAQISAFPLFSGMNQSSDASGKKAWWRS